MARNAFRVSFIMSKAPLPIRSASEVVRDVQSRPVWDGASISPVDVELGGQALERWPRELFVPPELAVQALNHFLEFSKQVPALLWVRIDGFPRRPCGKDAPSGKRGSVRIRADDDQHATMALRSTVDVHLEVPDELARQLASGSEDLARVALEALAAEGVRSGKLSVFQARELLGIQSRYERDGVLKKHGVFLDLTFEDVRKDSDAALTSS